MVKHPVILRGYAAAINDHTAEPVLVKRLDQEFVPGVLDGLRRKLSPDALGRPNAQEDFRGGNLRLFQPVHRTFNLVLLEAVCDRPGSPRLDPRDIASAGFVVRRVKNESNPPDDEGWLLRDDHIIGWSQPAEARLDPDPQHRRPRLNAGHPYVNGKLARVFQALEPAAERASPLFVAPPDVCIEAGRTLLYGLIPVTSAERSEEAQSVEVESDVVRVSMPEFLRPPGETPSRPNIVGPITLDDVNTFVATDPDAPLTRFMQELRLIHFGWRVFDSAEGLAILPLLNKLVLQFTGSEQPLGDFLHTLCRRFVQRDDGSEASIEMPVGWPLPDAALAGKIREAVQQSLAARLREGVPNQQRFDEPDALYRIHAFIRVRGAAGCPPALHWSKPSVPFAIVPWWESGGGPLHTISLPDLDRDSVKKIKPNVAFKVPPRLAAMLNRTTPEAFLDGTATLPNGGISLGWICSFSIPIITLCAFIVLNIFLVLLHLAFWWLFYIKICLPFPKPQQSSPP
jgi:hypothetical protein